MKSYGSKCYVKNKKLERVVTLHRVGQEKSFLRGNLNREMKKS